MLFMAFILPAMIGSIWGDARGAFFYAGVIRLVIVHHVRGSSRGSCVDCSDMISVDFLRQLACSLDWRSAI